MMRHTGGYLLRKQRLRLRLIQTLPRAPPDLLHYRSARQYVLFETHQVSSVSIQIYGSSLLPRDF